MEWLDIATRLGAATVIGMALGLNRDLRNKPTGARTLGLVGLGSAIAVLAMVDPTLPHGERLDATSRAVQGVLTGIGFLGAGVIVRGAGKAEVHGLTTAACTWLTACIGIVCAVAAWPVVVVSVPLVFFVLIAGGPIEKSLRARVMGPPGPPAPSP